MPTLSVNPEILRELIFKTRAAMVQAGHVSDDEGNLADDEGLSSLRTGSRDRSGDELIDQIDDLEPDQQAELVALLWLGRGDFEPEEWDEALKLAYQRQTGSSAVYLLSHPHIADHWDEGVNKLFDGSDLIETGEY